MGIHNFPVLQMLVLEVNHSCSELVLGELEEIHNFLELVLMPEEIHSCPELGPEGLVVNHNCPELKPEGLVGNHNCLQLELKLGEIRNCPVLKLEGLEGNHNFLELQQQGPVEIHNCLELQERGPVELHNCLDCQLRGLGGLHRNPDFR